MRAPEAKRRRQRRRQRQRKRKNCVPIAKFSHIYICVFSFVLFALVLGGCHIAQWKTKWHNKHEHIAIKSKINLHLIKSEEHNMLRCKQSDVMRILWVFGCLNLCVGFYLPGIAPVNYCKKSESEVCKVCPSCGRRSPIDDVFVRLQPFSRIWFSAPS